MSEDLIVRAFANRFRDNFSGAANAIDADDPGFDPRDSTEWFTFQIDTMRRKRRHRGDKLRVEFLATFGVFVAHPNGNVYDAPDYADELRELFEDVCFDVENEAGSVVGKIQTYDLGTTDATNGLEADLAEVGSFYSCKVRACATEL